VLYTNEAKDLGMDSGKRGVSCTHMDYRNVAKHFADKTVALWNIEIQLLAISKSLNSGNMVLYF
jgi:hypothetical protein